MVTFPVAAHSVPRKNVVTKLPSLICVTWCPNIEWKILPLPYETTIKAGSWRPVPRISLDENAVARIVTFSAGPRNLS